MKMVQLKMIFRSWRRNKIYTVISLLSLVTGLTCSLLMGGFILNEYRIAHAVPGSGSWYLLTRQNVFYTNTEVKDLTLGEGCLAELLHDSYPEFSDYCVFHQCQAKWMKAGKEEILTGFYEVMPSFADAFQPVVLEGDLHQTLSRAGEVAVTRSFALQHFGRENVTGETLDCESWKPVYQDGYTSTQSMRAYFTITSVIDDSRKNFWNFKLLKGLPQEEIAVNTRVWFNSYYAFVRAEGVPDVAALMQKVNADTTREVAKRLMGGKSPLSLLPIEEIYFTADSTWGSLFVNRDRSFLYIGISIALAVLLIACFNYINLNMTRTLQRLRNTGQQMVFGARKSQLRLQLIWETGMQVVLAVFVAGLLIRSFLPGFNGLFNARLEVTDFFEGITPWVLAALLGVIIVLPSLYIFYRLGDLQLIRLLKQEYSGRSRLITGMVVAQFTVSIVLLLFIVNVRNQMDFIAHACPESDYIMILRNEGRNEEVWKVFREKLAAIPEVEATTSGYCLAGGKVSNNGLSINMIHADEVYFDFYGLGFAEGRPFTSASSPDQVVVNEALVKKLELKNPVGYVLDFNGQKSTICGVVKDMKIDKFTVAVEPVIYYFKEGWAAAVKVRTDRQEAALAKMRQLWKEMAPDQPSFSWQTVADVYLKLHQDEQKIQRMVMTFSWVSLLLTCLGLFGLAWYSVENRIREIALRKVNGATELQVVGLLCRRFIGWILTAFVIAVPLGIYFTYQWMMQFVYREEAGWTAYLTVGLLALAVGVLTVVWQAWQAAVRNPVESLKNE